MPVTQPLSLTVTKAVFALTHIPPGERSDSCTESPTHTLSSPVIGFKTGKLFTVIVTVSDKERIVSPAAFVSRQEIISPFTSVADV
jgi:hypothetical protein